MQCDVALVFISLHTKLPLLLITFCYTTYFEMEAADLAEAIADLDRQERDLTLELMDVLTDIDTPDASDAEPEDEEVEELELPQVRNVLMQVDSSPSRPTEYSELYQRADYREKARLKVRFAQKLVKTIHLGPMMASDVFIQSLQHVESTYPDDGGRDGLNTLVAIHNVVKVD